MNQTENQTENTQWSHNLDEKLKKDIYEYIQNMGKKLSTLRYKSEVKNVFVDLINETRNQTAVQLYIKKNTVVKYFLGDDICSHIDTSSEIPSFKVATEHDQSIYDDIVLQRFFKKGVEFGIEKIYSPNPTQENFEEQFQALDHILKLSKGSIKNVESYLVDWLFFNEKSRSRGADSLVSKGLLALATDEGIKFLFQKHQEFKKLLSGKSKSGGN